MPALPIITVHLVSDSGHSRLCKLKLKPSIRDNPKLGGFCVERLGVEYLPGKKMDIAAFYNSRSDEMALRVTSGKRTIIGVAATVDSLLEASASIKADIVLRILVEEKEA